MYDVTFLDYLGHLWLIRIDLLFIVISILLLLLLSRTARKLKKNNQMSQLNPTEVARRSALEAKANRTAAEQTELDELATKQAA